MFNVLNTCYGQNLGYESSLTIVDIISRVLESERQLEEWRFQLLPTLGLHLWHKPMLAEDVEKIDPSSMIHNRFSVVLSVRYHNLRILLHRRFLESFLDEYGVNDSDTSDKKLLRQVGLTSVQNCVESATSIISTVHTITSLAGWRRELLGAWSYTLYYSTSSPSLYTTQSK